MLINFSQASRKIRLVMLATVLQCALVNAANSANTTTPTVPSTSSAISGDTQFPESSTAYQKILEIRQRASDLTFKAMDMLGIRYKRGGNTPENGLDCSGFVRYVFKDVLGANLPRTSAEISKVGEHIDPKDLQPGDLVFYNTLRRGFSHVGIYLGDNKFIHSPSAGGQVRVESMDIAYWKKRFNGARRINDLPETK